MTRPTEIRIDRLVLPASERHRTAAFRAALEHSLVSRLGGGDASAPPQSPLAKRTASTVAARIARQQP